MAGGPVREHASAAAAGDSHLVSVDVAAFDHFINAGHQVLVIITRVVKLDYVAEILAVRSASARVCIKHDVALRRHPLKLMREHKAVGGVWAAVNLEYKRVLL